VYRIFGSPLAWAAAVAFVAVTPHRAAGQETKKDATPLPPVVVEQPAASKPKAKRSAAKKQGSPAVPAASAANPVPAQTPSARAATGSPAQRAGSLTVPTTAEATAEIELTPGNVEVVPDSRYKNSTPASGVKDVLDYVPGVFAQPKWGGDTRISIRGSGLSNNYHLRSINLYMDGIPINTADGIADSLEIDPSLYRYTEVFRGANALRLGTNSLGGAINFVMPTGYDAALFGARVDVGSFGFHKVSLSSGGVSGGADYFIAGTWQETDGYREHSSGESVRGSANFGYRLSEDVETRFYINANTIRQRIPGEVTKEAALNDPQTAAPVNVANDWQRNIDSVRIANKTAVRLAPDTLLEFGGYYMDRHLMHPIFVWYDQQFDDYGGFARLTNRSMLLGHRNDLVAGVEVAAGNSVNSWNFIGPGAVKGDLLTRSSDDSLNFSAYAENSFYIAPSVALVAGTQFLHATRERSDVLNPLFPVRAPGESEFNLWNPKAGVLWNVDRGWQVFGNVARSAEVPTFDQNTTVVPFDTRAQRATTVEIGTRGNRRDYTWDLAVYRAWLDDELQCLEVNVQNGPTECAIVNADKTIHQGIEAGFGAAVWRSSWAQGVASDAVWFNAAYTFNDFFFDNDATFGDNEIPGVPRHYLRAEVLYKDRSGFYAGPNLEWVPQAYFVDNTNTFKTASYAIWGLKAGFDNGGPWSAYIEGRNLSDKAYISTSKIIGDASGQDLPLFNVGDGRAVYAGVQYKW
jgi:iron complex outermembrane receptor protein